MTNLMASYFIRNDDYSKSKQYVAFKFSIYRSYVSTSGLLRFSSMLWKTLMLFCILLVLGTLTL